MKSRLGLVVCIAVVGVGVICTLILLSSLNERDEPASSQPVGERPTLEFVGWVDFISPDAIAAFTEETGIPVNHTETESFDEVRAHLESAPEKYDLVIAESGTITEWVALDFIQPLDHQQLPMMRNMDQRYMNFVTDPGNAYSIPVLGGTTVLAYRRDLFKVADESWNVLWEPGLKGRISLLEDEREIAAIGLKRQGNSLNSSNQETLAAAERDLVDLARDQQLQFGDTFENLDKMVSGKVWMVQCYSGDAVIYQEDNPELDIAIFHPREGSIQWVDVWAIPRASAKTKEAHEFINYMMRPKAAALTSNYSRYRTPNRAAFPLLDEGLRTNPLLYPPAAVLDQCEVIDPRDAKRNEQLLRLKAKMIQAAQETQPSSNVVTP